MPWELEIVAKINRISDKIYEVLKIDLLNHLKRPVVVNHASTTQARHLLIKAKVKEVNGMKTECKFHRTTYQKTEDEGKKQKTKKKKQQQQMDQKKKKKKNQRKFRCTS